jgi:hypothetical protein
MPRNRELVSQIHAIKRRVLPSGKVSFDAERNAHARMTSFGRHGRPRTSEVAVRVIA